MPSYDYRCAQCGVFEVNQRITDMPLTACPTCNGPVRRLMSKNVNILFRGSGWHCTDYPSKGRKEEIQEEAKEATKAEAKEAAPAVEPKAS